MALEKSIQPGDHVLDLGTGSGILALAAAKLGARTVLALDTDPVAVAVARENVQLNGAADQVTVAQGSLELATDAFDLVVVNILAKVIVALAREGLAKRVRVGGQWVAAGIIDPQVDEVVTALTIAGLQVTEQQRITDWVTLIGCKPPES
jgi:ribosomal protein L11 methyltransferase